MYHGQAEQDKFILNILKNKRNGFFLEIGSNHPSYINNTYLLETQFGWRGVMVEYEKHYLQLYKEQRQNSIHMIDDARNINYLKLFKDNNIPANLDYLQIDLEANNGSTLQTLQKLDYELFDTYKFATVTFEHDFYHTNYMNTRTESRKIFANRGYVCVFEDIDNNDPNAVYEDWYVHPSLVDMSYVTELQQRNAKNYGPNNKTGKSLSWGRIEY
jgi:hypothetical protein